MSKIVDVIFHKNKYYIQRFLVVDEIPDLKYKATIKCGRKVLIAEDGIFFGLYYYDKPTENWQAFAGRKFDIPMLDGKITKAHGQWWHGNSGINVINVGIGTPERLGKCNVFCGCDVKKDVAEQVFNNFKNPSNNYYKYDKKHSDYGKNIIVSPWD